MCDKKEAISSKYQDIYCNKNCQEQILAEYNALRAEIIHRMSIRHQIVSFSVILLGAILAFKTLNGTTLLLYPILVLFLACGWAHNDCRVGEIGNYIKNNIEDKLCFLGWESFLYNTKNGEIASKYGFRATMLSAGGIFIGVQLISMVMAYIIDRQIFVRIDSIVVLDIVSIIITILVIQFRFRIYLKA
ncbi:MAG: hypothetical protein C4522_10625 [Desulfobacteraceae bacterium]|nr:MAG: hypothetical protein C4522_10625 [Desulfobacteraceae bacterium]